MKSVNIKGNYNIKANSLDFKLKKYLFKQNNIQYKKINKGRKFVKLLNNLKLHRELIKEDYVSRKVKTRFNILDWLFVYIESKYSKRYLDNINKDNYFYTTGFYFKYNNTYFKYVNIYGQGCIQYIARIKNEEVDKNYLIDIKT